MELLVRTYVRDLGLNYAIDQYGNIYVEKGNSHTYPCVVCHMDTVHDIESNLTMIEKNGELFGMNMITKKEAGIGGKHHCLPMK